MTYLRLLNLSLELNPVLSNPSQRDLSTFTKPKPNLDLIKVNLMQVNPTQVNYLSGVIRLSIRFLDLTSP